MCIADYVVDPAITYGARLPVGRPIHNTHLYLLDEHGALAPRVARARSACPASHWRAAMSAATT